MTTIAYRDGVLAADTLICANGYRVGFAPKIHRIGGVLVGGAGSVAYYEAFRDWIKSGLIGDHPLKQDVGNCFAVMPSGRTVCWCDNGPFVIRSTWWAFGSGEQIALGAMEAGLDAPDAVKAAITLDTRSGGEITVLRGAG